MSEVVLLAPKSRAEALREIGAVLSTRKKNDSALARRVQADFIASILAHTYFVQEALGHPVSREQFEEYLHRISGFAFHYLSHPPRKRRKKKKSVAYA